MCITIELSGLAGDLPGNTATLPRSAGVMGYVILSCENFG